MDGWMILEREGKDSGVQYGFWGSHDMLKSGFSSPPLRSLSPWMMNWARLGLI